MPSENSVPNDGGPAQSEQLRIRTATAILRAAAECFVTHGYERSTTRMIASAAGVPQGLIYYHFENKESILFQLFIEGIDAVLTPAVEIANREDLTSRQAIECLLRSHLLPFAQRDPIRTFSMQAIPRDILKPDHWMEYVAKRNAYQLIFEAIIERGQVNGEVAVDVDVKIMTYTILGFVNHLALWFHVDGRLSTDEIVDRFVRVIMSGALLRDFEVAQ